MKSGTFKLILSKEYFLLLLPLFFVFHSYTENVPLISPSSTLLLFGAYATVFFLFNTFIYLFNKNWRKASVFTFIVMCSFFFFGSFHDLSKKLLEQSFITKYTFILPVLLVFYFSTYFLIKKAKFNFQRIVGYLNCLLILLLLIDVSILLTKKSNSTNKVPLLPYTSCDSCDKPDIYFIIADEYIGNKVLKEQFAFDNNDFENELRKRGFYVINNSLSNYNYTPYSVASILNMDYLSRISRKSNDNKNRNISYGVINSNALTQFLTSQGYSIVNHSLFDLTDQPTKVNSMFFLTREKLITHQTLLGRIDRDLRFNLVTRFKIHSEIKRFAMSTLENNLRLLTDTYSSIRSERSTPIFVYTHLMMPHYPYYFKSNGEPYPLDSLSEGNQISKNLYIDYLKYCNKVFLNLLDSILRNSPKPPIIIFMGDHGFRHFTEPVDGKYQFLNLNAVYLPNKSFEGFYDGISAVNQFRVILNTQFKQKLPLLKDSTIYLKEY